MAQPGSVASGQHRGRPAPACRQGGVADRVHAAVNGVEPADPKPVVDRPVADPEIQELLPAHDAPLPLGKRGNRGRVESTLRYGVNSPHAARLAREASRDAAAFVPSQGVNLTVITSPSAIDVVATFEAQRPALARGRVAAGVEQGPTTR